MALIRSQDSRKVALAINRAWSTGIRKKDPEKVAAALCRAQEFLDHDV